MEISIIILNKFVDMLFPKLRYNKLTAIMKEAQALLNI